VDETPAYVDPITASSFDFFSALAGGHGPFQSAAHIGGIGPDGALSGWIAPTAVIPEPTTILLIGSGLFGLAGFRRKFRR